MSQCPNGPELVERLRRLQHEIKVLYISGYVADSTIGVEGLAPGGAFLRKPYTRGSLIDKVKEMIAVKEDLQAADV